MTRSKVSNGLLVLIAATVTWACGRQAPEPAAQESNAENVPETVEPEVSIYATAVSSSARTDGDRESDAGRMPAQVLEFMGIEPGMTVLDMFTGGGYYAELLSNVVGPEGKVIAHSNEPYLAYVGDAFDERFADGRLGNVEILMAENNELALEPDSLDAVMLVQSFHDLYHVDEENGWLRINVPAFLAELKNGLKPGGIVAIIDHSAEAGAPSESGDTVHRIDPAIVISEMQAAGFVLGPQSFMLRNPDDDRSKSVFAPEVRGNTDRFVMRFRNPG